MFCQWACGLTKRSSTSGIQSPKKSANGKWAAATVEQIRKQTDRAAILTIFDCIDANEGLTNHQQTSESS